MKKTLLTTVLVVAALATVFTSCKKDSPDVRDAAVGTYNYTSIEYVLTSINDALIDGVTGDAGTLSVAKGAKDDEINITLDGTTFAAKVIPATDGFALTIDIQEFPEGLLGGEELFEVGGKKYDGAFSNKTLVFSLGAITEDGIAVATFSATKK